MLTEIKRSSLVSQVIAYLTQQIQSGQWSVGYKLPPENLLATELKVGRSTVREAVRVLAHSGLVEVRQGAGTFVIASQSVTNTSEPDNDESLQARLKRARILDIYEVRRAIELEAARLAALRRDETDLARLDAALEGRKAARAAGSSEAFIKADLDFHLAVADAADNPVLSELFAAFADALQDALSLLSADNDFRLDTIDEHVRLAEAIRRQDSEAAAQATLQHLDATVTVINRLLAAKDYSAED